MYYIPTFQKVKHIFSKKLKKFFAAKKPAAQLPA